MVTDGKQWTPLPPMEILPQICFGQAASLAQLRVEPSVTIRLDQTNVPAPDLEAPREGDPGELRTSGFDEALQARRLAPDRSTQYCRLEPSHPAALRRYEIGPIRLRTNIAAGKMPFSRQTLTAIA
jgi:hypothetical protein